MYSREDRTKAVELYIKYDMCFANVMHELGYPDRQTLYKWYRWYLEEQRTGELRQNKLKYTPEQKQAAVDYYLEHGRSISRTMRALGYPSKPKMIEWRDELAPGTKRLRKSAVQFTREQKGDAVVAFCTRDKSAEKIACDIEVTRQTLYAWKYELLGKEVPATMPKDAMGLPDDIDELTAQVKSLKDEVYRLKLERDILQGTVEIVKKDPGADPLALTNTEKTMLIDALKPTYPLKVLLYALKMPKSSYFYCKEAFVRPDKYVELRIRICELFEENRGRYGYRRIHMALKREETTVSEKVVCHIMSEENLVVATKRKRKYSSYVGEVTPAPDNLLERDFSSDYPNEKWLTDVTEFHIPSGKIYLSPIIDCFDGMAVSWTISTSPNAEMANSMLEGAISTLGPDERPTVHSDRGGTYRWPGWIKIMEESGLTRSMSKKGCSPDNSACEGFFGRLKNEFFYNRCWKGVSIDDFIDELDDYIHWYNEVRIKISLGGCSPLEYRRNLGLAA